MTIDQATGGEVETLTTRSDTGPTRLFFRFTGEGSDLFGISFLNTVFSLCTLGIWYAWGRVRELNFLIGHVVCGGDPMSFHGRGGELLRGVLIAIFGFVLPFYVLFFFAGRAEPRLAIPMFLAAYALMFTFVAFASIGSLRYRLPRTEWRGLRFGFDGRAKDFMLQYVPRLIAVVLTLGIAYPYVACWRRQWVLSRCRYGDVYFDCDIDSNELYPAFIGAWLLTPFTLGWSIVWYQGHQQAYLWNHTRLGNTPFSTEITGSGWLGVHFASAVFAGITLGLATPWTIVRMHRYFFENLTIENTPELTGILARPQQSGGLGEGMLDVLDADSGLDLG